MSDHITASPLTWPDGWTRTEEPARSRFGKWNSPVTIAQATSHLLSELMRMGIPDCDVIISADLRLRNDGLPYSNQKSPKDKGVAVWWLDAPQQRVIALDKYDRIADNIWAIAKTIEAMRGIERWGAGEILERVFTGFNALPSPESVSTPSWRTALNYFGDNLQEAKIAYKKIRSKSHPDNGGDIEIFHLINRAWQQAEIELREKDE